MSPRLTFVSVVRCEEKQHTVRACNHNQGRHKSVTASSHTPEKICTSLYEVDSTPAFAATFSIEPFIKNGK